jgi:hypothetical protein
VAADLTPAGCLQVTWQGFFLTVDVAGVHVWSDELATIPYKSYSFETYPTFDLLLFQLQEDGADVVLASEYIQTEKTSTLLAVGTAKPLENFLLRRRYFASDDVVYKTIQEFFIKEAEYHYGWNTSQTIQYWIEQLMSVKEVERMILWVAYWLVDERRMYLSAAAFLAGNDVLPDTDTSYKNTGTEITTKIGDTFTIVERQEEEGKAAEDFTALWGDKYTYLSKHQLYIRNKLEKLFEDFSLRDNIVVSSTFEIEKTWTPKAFYGSAKLSEVTINLLR